MDAQMQMRYIILIEKSVICHTSAIANLKTGNSPVPSVISVKVEFVGMRATYFTFVKKNPQGTIKHRKHSKAVK
jgi:hypothetical protein